MRREGHLLFSKDFENKIASGDITLETALKHCPNTRLDSLNRTLGLV